MCWAEKCCFCIKTEPGSIAIGFISLFLSATMIATSAVFFSSIPTEYPDHSSISSSHSYLHPGLTKVLTLVLTPHQRTGILCSVLAVGVMLLLASIMLMVGIIKKRAGFVLFYFGFGIFFVIFGMLGALLLIVQTHWEASLVVFITSGIYIHFLVVIHTFYDHMQKENYVTNSHGILIEEDSISILSRETRLE
ncbi:hypothetical protein NE865_04704 [Phthorimaea operculella]|nr:hypothetical protein NE865_04704 [Phthorimaea operculella]